MDNYTGNILQTINSIVEANLNTVAFDTTEICEIISQDTEDKQKYIVSNGAVKFEAYSMDSTKSYNDKSQVYVLIPKGDYSGTKVIIGGQGQETLNEEEVNQYTNPLDTIIIANQLNLGLNDGIKIDNTISSNQVETIINISDLECNAGFGNYDYVGIEFSFNSDIDDDSEYYIQLDFLDSTGNSIIPIGKNFLVLKSDQIYGNPNSLNENFSFQHLFYFPKLKTNYDTIEQIKVTLLTSKNLSETNFVELKKLNMYFGYSTTNEQLLGKEARMTITFPKNSVEDIKKSYVSSGLTNYDKIANSYKEKELSLYWYKDNKIFHNKINNTDDLIQLSNYNIYWCQYLSKTPYTKLLDSDIGAIRECYYNKETNNQWFRDNISNTEKTFTSLYYQVIATDGQNDNITLSSPLESILKEDDKVNFVQALYFLKTENTSDAPEGPKEKITSTSKNANQWSTVCPNNTEYAGAFYICMQKISIDDTVNWTTPQVVGDAATNFQNITIYFRSSLENLEANSQDVYNSNLNNHQKLKDKFVDNTALLNEYKNIYTSNTTEFEQALFNRFKDIIESGTYWQTMQKYNASDPKAFLYKLHIPKAGSDREQNEEQVKVIIKNADGELEKVDDAK